MVAHLRSRAGCSFALGLVLASGEATAQPAPRWPGSWSAPRSTLTYNLPSPAPVPAIHLALLRGQPGANPPSHSKILYWQQGDATTFYAGMWRWREIDDANGEITTQKFADHGAIPHPGVDLHCTGAVHTGRNLLVAGGTGGEGVLGITESLIYDTDQGLWVPQGDMAEQRWYPSLLPLSDGRVLARSGSRFNPMYVFGGSTTPSGDQPTHELYALGLTSAGLWLGPYAQSGQLPVPRTGLGAGAGNFARWIFGGLAADGSYLNDTWRTNFDKNPLGADYDYGWRIINNGLTTVRPLGRAQSATVMIDDLNLVVFGGKGRDASQNLTVFGDVWLLTPDAQGQFPNTHKWVALTQAGAEQPGPRFGHAAAYDPASQRILIFGGTTDLSNALAPNDVWSLKIDTGTNTATWTRVLIGDTGHPGARMGHSFTIDRSGRYNEGQFKQAVFLFGGRVPGAPDVLGNDLWTLWVPFNESDPLEWQFATPVQGQPVPQARADHSAMFDVTGRLVVLGGDTGGASGDATTWAADVSCPPGNCEIPADWTQMTSIGSGRSGHVAWYDVVPHMSRQSEIIAPGIASPGAWSMLAGATLWQEFYPFNFVMPGEGAHDRIFSAGADVNSYVLDAAGGPWTASAASGFRGGTAVMYRPGRVMKCGSRDSEIGQTAVATTKTIDLSAATPAWTPSDGMAWGRVNHNLTVLPSGEALVTGGTGFVDENHLINPRQQPELWDPDENSGQGIWYGASGPNALASDPIVRDYHSTALLLPDGRVLVAGGDINGSPPGADKGKATLYTPPYLFDDQGRVVGSSGCTVSRPVVTGAPEAIGYGETFAIGSPTAGSIASVCLIRPGSVTHGFDQDQLFVPLAFSHFAAHEEIRVTAPRASRDVPPGDYLLFVLNSDGVPSIARWVEVGGCGAPPCDTRPPLAATDLAVDLMSESSATLLWTAPADVGGSGAAEYDVRYSPAPILDDAAFAWATAFTAGVPTPGTPGSAQSCEITGLSPGTEYHFAIKTRDVPGSWSPASNPARATTLGAPRGSDPEDRPIGGGSDTLDTLPPPATTGSPATLRIRGGGVNPFVTATELRFETSAAGRVRIEVYDVQGRVVRVLADREFAAGTHGVRWDGRGEHGGALPNGVYLARVSAGALRAERRLVLIRI